MKPSIRRTLKPTLSKRLKDMLSKDHSCYVVITCGKPKGPGGTMDVQMEYEGDPLVASFLLQGAQERIDQELDFEE